MKKNSILFSVMAVAFAATTAFAFKGSSAIQHGYIDANNNCKRTNSVCPSGPVACQLDVSEEPGSTLRSVGDFDQSCQILTMP